VGVIRARQAAFVFRYFTERSFGQDTGTSEYMSALIETTTTYDDGLEFVVAFQEAFPGRVLDGDHYRASARLSRLLKLLHDDGWMERINVSNYEQYHPRDEPNWQYAYRIPGDLLARLKTGKETPETLAERWSGQSLSSPTPSN